MMRVDEKQTLQGITDDLIKEYQGKPASMKVAHEIRFRIHRKLWAQKCYLYVHVDIRAEEGSDGIAHLSVKVIGRVH